MEKRKKIACLIAITGPESTGKTTLTRELAEYFKGYIVPEYAREYLSKCGPNYGKEEFLKIVDKQLQLEAEAVDNPIVFCDTDRINFLIWTEDKQWILPSSIWTVLEEDVYAHHLLLKPDIPYKQDALRENPNRSDELFLLFKKKLDELKRPYTVITGKEEIRLHRAIRAVELCLNA